MTIYEQIQSALDYIEGRLFSDLRLDGAAREAGMSSRSFHHWFWAVTGYSFKEYVVKRRMSEAQVLLSTTDERVIDIALRVGYESHEAFSRAFKNVFGASPVIARKVATAARGLAKPNLVKEMYMGVIIKELPDMDVVAFDGYEPEPETKAHQKLEAWAKKHPPKGKPRRVFGYNIDRAGNLDCNPQNVGYRFIAAIDDPAEAEDAKTMRLGRGKYAVTGTEGEANGIGGWIGAGWKRLNAMIAEKGFTVKRPARWFEEELEPSKPGMLRLDLYLEIE